jgi:hypothetical protein
MDAYAARRLRVGDKVVAPFSNSHRLATITAIEWPHFDIETTLANGEKRQQRNRYRALKNPEHYVKTYGPYAGMTESVPVSS